MRLSAIADLHPERVEDHDRIHPVQRPALPFADLVEHGIGHTADQIGRDLQPIDLFKMGADIADTQPGGVEPDDLVVHAVDPGLALLNQLLLEVAVPVARNRNLHFPVLTLQNRPRCAVTAIGLPRWRVVAFQWQTGRSAKDAIAPKSLSAHRPAIGAQNGLAALRRSER